MVVRAIDIFLHIFNCWRPPVVEIDLQMQLDLTAAAESDERKEGGKSVERDKRKTRDSAGQMGANRPHAGRISAYRVRERESVRAIEDGMPIWKVAAPRRGTCRKQLRAARSHRR